MKETPDSTVCQLCNSDLLIADSKYIATGDTSPDTVTEIFVELTMVCPNPKCKDYAGTNHNKPKKVAKMKRNRVGQEEKHETNAKQTCKQTNSFKDAYETNANEEETL